MLPEYFNVGEIEQFMCGQCVHRSTLKNCRERFAQIVSTVDGNRWICTIRHKAVAENAVPWGGILMPDNGQGRTYNSDKTVSLEDYKPFPSDKTCATCRHKSTKVCNNCIGVTGSGKPPSGWEQVESDIVTNEKGAKQSKINHEWLDFDPTVLLWLAEVSAQGKAKYGPENWRKISAEDHINHALTHIFMHLTGDKSEPHLLHAICRLIFTVGVGENGEKETQ